MTMTTSTADNEVRGGRRHVVSQPAIATKVLCPTEGSSVAVSPSARPLNPQLGEVTYGSKPVDGGWLTVYPEEHEEVMADPIAARYVKKYVGARELLHDEQRYCLWLAGAEVEEVRTSLLLRRRVEGVRAFRAASRAASTREAASKPHLFQQIAQPSTSYLCIPAHVPQSRSHFLVARLGPDVVTSNANFLTADADGFIFAIISSTMFITWQRAVGRRIRSDLRFDKLLIWNTFPLPPTGTEARRRIIAAGEGVLEVRQRQPGVSLADLYAPITMSDELINAHEALDSEVDQLFGLTSQHPAELERRVVLCAGYREMTVQRSGRERHHD
jgi:hypothetical protein